VFGRATQPQSSCRFQRPRQHHHNSCVPPWTFRSPKEHIARVRIPVGDLPRPVAVAAHWPASAAGGAASALAGALAMDTGHAMWGQALATIAHDGHDGCHAGGPGSKLAQRQPAHVHVTQV